MRRKRSKVKGFLGLIMVLVLVLAGCDLLGEIIPVEEHTLTVIIEGVGDVNYSGSNTFEKGTVVDLTVSASDPWEFYAWTGEDAKDVTKTNGIYRITMDRDKEITAFFAEEFFEFVMEEHHYMGSGGEAIDLTDNAPYPPGFVIELQAIPATSEDAFLHWSTTAGDPRDYFEDYEAEITRYTVPGIDAVVTPYFTRRTPPQEPGEFDYDHTHFGVRMEGRVGLTQHYWDISAVGNGVPLDFFFHARNLPDRFRVYYGQWHDLTLIFCSGWVSLDPDRFEDPNTYPEGVLLHDWHENVELSSRITFGWGGSPGGGYESILIKESGKDVLMIEVEGRDDGTIWDYIVDSH